MCGCECVAARDLCVDVRKAVARRKVAETDEWVTILFSTVALFKLWLIKLFSGNISYRQTRALNHLDELSG